MEQMEPTHKKPVIIGTGLTGLAISYKLSKEGVDHILIGRPPADDYHFGESLDGSGTLEFLDLLSEFSEYSYPKRGIASYIGDTGVKCDMRIAKQPALRTLLWFLRIPPPKYLLHLDRRNLDQAVFRKCIESVHCQYLDQEIMKIQYDKSNSVDILVTSDGAAIQPSYVFDVSSHGSPTVASCSLEKTVLSSRQRVLSVHYTAPVAGEDDVLMEPPWADVTSLIQLRPDIDGIDGLTWCVAAGKALSIGVTVEAKDCEISSERILELVEESYKKKGLNIRSHYPESSPVKELTHEYFMYENVCGPNWVLAGSAACQVWFMSSSGVGSGLAIASMALDFITNPLATGRRYRRYVATLREVHNVNDRIRYDNHAQSSDKDKHNLSDLVLHLNVKRVIDSVALKGRWFVALLGRFVYWTARSGIILKRYCILEHHTVSCLSPKEMKNTVLRLLDAPAGKTPVTIGDEILTSDVVVDIDNWEVRGIHRWKQLNSYFKYRRENLDLTLQSDSITIDGPIVLFKGHVTGTDVTRETLIRVKFRFIGDRIDRIYTTRSNYAVVFGESYVKSIQFWYTVLRGYIWCKFFYTDK